MIIIFHSTLLPYRLIQITYKQKYFHRIKNQNNNPKSIFRECEIHQVT